MALVVKDRVRENSTTTGTGSLTLSGAVTGFQTFSTAIGNGNTTYYAIVSGSEWEVGLGTVSAGALSRDTVLSSSTGSKVSFSAGTKDVFCTYPSNKSVYRNGSDVAILSSTDITTGLGYTPLNAANNLSDVANTATSRSNLGVTATGSDTTYVYRANNLSDLANTTTARSNLGVTATGSDTTYAYRANNLSDLANATTARTNLGLGTIATQAASSVAITGGAIDGTTIGSTTPSTVSGTLLKATNGIIINNMTIGTSYSIPSGYGAHSVGAVTLSSGVSVTVPSGSRWVVL
jgi:hypothetical protein